MSLLKYLGISFVSALLALLVLAPSATPATHAGISEPPPNDDFADATEVTLLPFSDEVDMEGATLEEGEGWCSSDGVFTVFFTVWYRYTAAEDSVLVASAGTEGRTMGLGVWKGGDTGLQKVACDGYRGFGGMARASFAAEAGATYYFQVDLWSPEETPLTTFSLKATAQPAHDDFANAMSISTLPFSEILNTGAATREQDEATPCLGNRQISQAEATVWYAFTPDENMVLLIDTAGTDFDVFVNVFDAGDAQLELIRCNVSSVDTRVGIQIEAGQPYYVQVGGRRFQRLEVGTLSVELSEGVPPANGDFIGAIDIAEVPFEADIDTIAAGVEPGEPVPSCARDDVGSSVWYRISPSEHALIVVDTFGEHVVPLLGVYQGDSVDTLTQVVCGEPNFRRRAILGFEAVPGETYYLQVVATGDGGNVTLEIVSRDIPSCPAPEFTVADQMDDFNVFVTPVEGRQYHDILSTSVSTTLDDVCLRVDFAGRVDSPDSGAEQAVRGRVQFNLSGDTRFGGLLAACDGLDTFGVDMYVDLFGGYGHLASISGTETPPDFAVMTFEDQTMTIAIPKEFLEGGEAFRYAVWAFTGPDWEGGGQDCAPDNRFIVVPPLPYGDATCDRSVNAVDAAVILQYSAGLTPYVDCSYVADANGDGTISSIDAALILQLGAGLIDALPGEP